MPAQVTQGTASQEAGAALLDFTNSGPVAGAAVVSAVKIPSFLLGRIFELLKDRTINR